MRKWYQQPMAAMAIAIIIVNLLFFAVIFEIIHLDIWYLLVLSAAILLVSIGFEK